jgi:hypothetical protein
MIMSPRMTIAAASIAGITAGFVLSPVFWVATLIVVVLLSNGFRSQNDSGPATASEWSKFSDELRDQVDRALNATSGDAHRGLLDVAVCARSLLATTASNFDASHDRTTRATVERLVEACCGIALELSRVDETLAAGTSDHAAGSASRDRLTDARTLLANRLKDAGDAMRQLYATGLSAGTDASRRVAELTSELTDDAAARAAAISELSNLLGAVEAEKKESPRATS